jgi:hypothetical protein
MTIQGSRERILDSVLPHEITNTIFATHFGRPLPRWADEGACTTVEHAAERQKQEQLLIQFLTTNRGIAFNKMFAMMEYPSDMLPLYSQGYALAQFFIAQGGKQKFVRYVGEGMATNNWTAATRKYYGYESLSDLQVTWVEWIRHGRQTPIPAAFAKAPELQLASAAQNVAENATVRQQSPDGLTPVQTAVATTAADKSGSAGRGQPGSNTTDSASQPATDIMPISAVAGNAQPGDDGKRYAPGSTGRVGMIERTATRPQPMGQTQQQVLEWERSAPLDARVPTGTVLR